MKFEGKMFFKATISLDNNHFYDCIFDSCILVYRGGTLPNVVKCSFKNTSFGFGEAAANTFFLIATMYHAGFKDAIEKAINNMAAGVNVHEGKIILN